jgi:hypothetical protein
VATVSAFQTLFGNLEGGLITMSIAYSSQVPPGAADDDGLVVTVPVALYPSLAPGPGIAEVIGAAIREWEANNPLPGTGREWIFSLTFYSGIDGMSAPPLLTLDRLTYRIDRVPSQAQP